jgi:predicted component of type VI protein secretion system
MAGMRAALAGVLERFDPQAIEARLQVPTVMDKVLVSGRKARMWDRMVELYAELASEADSDFHRLFGEAFGAAYEEQINQIELAKPNVLE